jgi:hypothetical protein
MIVVAALLLIFIFDLVVAKLTPVIAQRAENFTNNENVLRLRRAETIAGLWITVIRVMVVLGAIFIVWKVTNPSTAPLALIGFGTLGIVLGSATIAPLLRDVTYGFIMIVERWYNVGDHVVLEPFLASGGVVERMTLRSTKLRNVNGEAVWVHHQHIQVAKVTSAGSHPLAIETFVNDPERGRQIIEEAVKIIPSGPTTVPVPLTISETKKVSDNIWRITAICEVTPFREWIIDNFALDVIRKTDQLTGKDPVIVHGPIAYYADATAERRYRRTTPVRNKLRSADKPR